MSRYLEQNTGENFDRFLQVFLRSQVGVIVVGAAQGTSGQRVLGKGEGLGLSRTPDGKKTILACADRAIFVRRFAKYFNAEIGAIELLKAAWSDPTCDGITINSAASEHGFVIPRERIAKIIAGITVDEQVTPMSRLAGWFLRHWRLGLDSPSKAGGPDP